MSALNPVAVDAMLEMLFVQFQEHRWQTKLAAVRLFSALAESDPKAITFNLPKVVRALMEVSQDPKPQIKETALVALKSCVQVIDNPDIIPVLDAVISANLNPETEGESCLDRLVATTYVNNVDKATLSVIVPILMRGLRVRGNVIMQRKAAIVMDTMCKLVKDPEEIAPFAEEVLPDLTRNAEEIAIPEVRERTAEALNTVKVAMGDMAANAVACDPVEVEAVLSEQISGNAYNSDEVSQWASQVCTPFFKDCRPRTNEMVVPYLKAIMSEAEAIINGEKFLETGATKFGAGQEEEVVEDHDDLAVLCDCMFSLAYGNRVLLHNTKLKLKRGKCYGLIGPTARASRR
jgi:elongation factor 3